MIDGFVVVDKPAGCTSHDVVARCRRALGQKKVGHGGTLDPDATGVLLVGAGAATRLLRYATGLRKAYVGEIVLGRATSTLDDSGEVVGEWDMASVTLDDARAAATGLVGDIEQVPPMVSAVQVGGVRLHELARQGIEVDRPARPVTVHRFDVSATGEAGVLRAEVECSAGTYVRVLAADLGALLGGGAHLRRLRRTAVGSFTEAEAVALDSVGPDSVVAPAEGLRDLPALRVDEAGASAVSHGRRLDRRAVSAPPGDGPVRVLDHGGRLLAVYEGAGDRELRPAVVLAAR